MIELAKIRTDGGTQSRAAINEETVAEYAEAMREPETVFPPVIVYYDGRAYWLADGFHRVEAWRQVGRVEVPAEVRQGDRRQAILHSCGANAAHGLRRSPADKKRAVWTLLEDPEWSEWSDREIARRVRVSPSTVAKYRTEISGVTVQLDSEPRTYTTKHGTEATMNTANIGTSKPDQETPPTPADGACTPDAVDEGTSGGGALTPAAAPEPPKEKEPKHILKLRREFRSLTPEAQEDDWVSLHQHCDELKNKVREWKGKFNKIKKEMDDLTADDKAEVIRRLQAEVNNAGNAKWKAIQDRDAFNKQVYALKKRVAELEQMGVAY